MVQHVPHKVKTAILVTSDSPNLLSNATVIKYYPQLTNFHTNLSTEVVLCQMMYISTHKLELISGNNYKFRLAQLHKSHFPWIGSRQISRITNELVFKEWITIDSKLGCNNDYNPHPEGLKAYDDFLKKGKKPFISVYPDLVTALTPEKVKGQTVAVYDPNGYGATALQQCMILTRLHRLVGTKEDKTIIRSHEQMHKDFFQFMGFDTYLKAIKALMQRGLMLHKTVGQLGLDTNNHPNCNVYQINYELLQKEYMPLIKPMSYDLTTDKPYYADTYSKEISYEDYMQVGYKNTNHGYLIPK